MCVSYLARLVYVRVHVALHVYTCLCMCAHVSEGYRHLRLLTTL